MNHRDKIKNKKVLVTGGLGFVGQNLVKSLIHNYDCKVIVVDDCSNSNPSVLSNTINDVEFHQISVLDYEKLFPLIDRVNYVFHLACRTILTCGTDPIMDLKVNAESTLQILEYLRNNMPSDFERFLYTSSVSVYGSTRNLPAKEDGITSVLSQYAATKLLGENYTSMYNILYDLPTTVVRYSNVYGYGQTPRNPYCGVIGKFIDNAINKKPLVIYGDGEQTRDYTFVNDSVDATILAAAHSRSVGDIFNVGTSIEISVNQLAEILQKYFPELSVRHVPERDVDNIRRRFVDIDKIHQRLNWTPRFSFQSGIEETIRWYKNSLQN